MKLQNIIIFIIIILFIKYSKLENSSFIPIHEKKLIELPNYVKNMHTIYIDTKIVPKKLYIKTNDLVKWINKKKNNNIITILNSNNTKISISKELSNNDFHYYIFNKSDNYYYYINNINYIIYEIIVQ